MVFFFYMYWKIDIPIICQTHIEKKSELKKKFATKISPNKIKKIVSGMRHGVELATGAGHQWPISGFWILRFWNAGRDAAGSARAAPVFAGREETRSQG